jgi:hypothetical protein
MTGSLENFAGICRHLDVNCVMVKRALCVATGLFCAALPVVAQQARHSIVRERLPSNGVLNAPLSLSLYQARNSSASDGSLLLHNGSVPLWLDGFDPSYSLTTQWIQMGFMSPDILPAPTLSAAPPFAQAPHAGRAHSSDGKDRGADGKDIGNDMTESPLSRVYYGGEVGFLYGQWSGKGGGDMWETYVVGTVGNDKFQITAGASFDEWNGNGRSVRFRSYAAPR